MTRAGRLIAAGGGWATAIAFPSEGCWRVTARAAGIRLSYVTMVTAR